MPSIADHWVRLSNLHLAFIIDGPPDQEDDTDSEYLDRLSDWGDRVAEIVENGLETW